LGLFPNILLDNTTVCEIHTKEWAANQAHLQAAIQTANQAIGAVKTFMAQESDRLTNAQINTLNGMIDKLEKAIGKKIPDLDAIIAATNNLLGAKDAIQAALPPIIEDPDPPEEPPDDDGGGDAVP